MTKIKFASLFIILFTCIQVLAQRQKYPKYELRGVWVATVGGIDWPTKADGDTETQKAELLNIIETVHEANFNVIYLQIRPASDAFYKSSIEPWSEWLTGKQGKAPKPKWDPLQYAIAECHKRGIELHAWFNPFRVTQSPTSELSSKSIGQKHPEWIVKYGRRTYLDPGFPGVRVYINQVVADVTKRYNLDGIHFDDYFYPYPIAGVKFPDTNSFDRHNRGYRKENIDDWRRENVDLVIQSLSKTIKSIDKNVEFGISPFGVWLNKSDSIIGSETNGGTTCYNSLYADVIKWQKEGWIDYLTPQIYWEIGHPAVDFETLNDWWANHAYGRHVYVGHAIYKASEQSNEAWKDPKQLANQFEYTRQNENIHGNVYFRTEHLMENPFGFYSDLKNKYYKYPALTPPSRWIDDKAPRSPHKLKKKGLFFGQRKLKIIEKGHVRKGTSYVVYFSKGKKRINTNNVRQIYTITSDRVIDLPKKSGKKKDKTYFWVTKIDQQKNESQAIGGVKVKL